MVLGNGFVGKVLVLSIAKLVPSAPIQNILQGLILRATFLVSFGKTEIALMPELF